MLIIEFFIFILLKKVFFISISKSLYNYDKNLFLVLAGIPAMVEYSSP